MSEIIVNETQLLNKVSKILYGEYFANLTINQVIELKSLLDFVKANYTQYVNHYPLTWVIKLMVNRKIEILQIARDKLY